VQRVVEAAAEFDPVAGLALRLAAITGARRSELAALRWSDLHGERLTIDSAIETIRNGKRGRATSPSLIDAATKTGNRREVVLDRETLSLILVRRRECEPYGPWMFSLGEDPPNPDRIGAWWRRAREAAGIDKSWRLHDLRHWAATLAIARGHDVRTVGHRLGHANAAMTLHYAHPREEVDRAIATSLADALSHTRQGDPNTGDGSTAPT
jgi:integrase